MRLSSMVFLAPAAALAMVLGCGGGDTVTSGTGTGGGAATTATSGTGGAATTASGTGGSTNATSSGQSGTGGAATTGSGSSSVSSSGTGSNACTWAAVDPCGPGMYCDAPGCQQGTCAPTGGVETSDKTPVCGCDGVTYWNGSIAKSHGQSVSKANECMLGKTCGGFGGIKCPGKATCTYQFPDSSLCNAADVGGTCWVTPDVCPPVVLGSKAHPCGAVMCADECSLMKSGASYYTDSTCPQ